MEDSQRNRKDQVRLAWLQLAAMSLLILSYLWGWQSRFEGDPVVAVLLFAVIAIWAHRSCSETARDLGFRFDNLVPSVTLVLLVVIPLAAVMYALGSWSGQLRLRPPEVLWSRLLVLPISGLIQQYGLLGFFLRRFDLVLPDRVASILAASTMFALFHLPNLPLTVATLLMGLLACMLYRRAPNLYALAVAHTILSFTIDTAFSGLLVDGMKVGHRALG